MDIYIWGDETDRLNSFSASAGQRVDLRQDDLNKHQLNQTSGKMTERPAAAERTDREVRLFEQTVPFRSRWYALHPVPQKFPLSRL